MRGAIIMISGVGRWRFNQETTSSVTWYNIPTMTPSHQQAKEYIFFTKFVRKFYMERLMRTEPALELVTYHRALSGPSIDFN